MGSIFYSCSLVGYNLSKFITGSKIAAQRHQKLPVQGSQPPYNATRIKDIIF